MDELKLRQRIRECVQDVALEAVLMQLVALRNAMKGMSEPLALWRVVSSSPLEKVNLEILEKAIATVEDEELRKELDYLLNLYEDIKSGKLARDLRSLSDMDERMKVIGYLSAVIVVFILLAYRFLSGTSGIKPFVLALAFIILLACGAAFLKTVLTKKEILKSFAFRYNI